MGICPATSCPCFPATDFHSGTGRMGPVPATLGRLAERAADITTDAEKAGNAKRRERERARPAGYMARRGTGRKEIGQLGSAAKEKKKKHALHCPARPMTVLCPRVNVAPSRRHSTHTHTRTHRHTKLQKPPDGYGNPVDRKDRAELGAGPRARVTSIPSIIHPIHPSIR